MIIYCNLYTQYRLHTCRPMRLATMRCTRTSASVLKSCANRLLLASSPHFSWTSMDSSRWLDRHIRATWAAASEARRAHPVRPPLHRRGRSRASAASSEQDIRRCSHGVHRAKLERDVRVAATTSAGGEKINHCVARYRRRGGGRLRGRVCQSTIILLYYYTYRVAVRRVYYNRLFC